MRVVVTAKNRTDDKKAKLLQLVLQDQYWRELYSALHAINGKKPDSPTWMFIKHPKLVDELKGKKYDKWFWLKVLGWFTHPIKSWCMRHFQGETFDYDGFIMKKELN